MTNWAAFRASPAIASYDMFASVTHDKVGRVKEVTRGFSTDATKTVYVYDEAGRTTQIRHEGVVGPNTLHQTTYTWNLNNTLASRVETDNFGLTVATVAFTYDNRDRLIREEREQAYNGGSAATAYDYRYGYDQLGNRKWRIDAATSERPAYYYTYLYDTDVDPENLDWPTRNNRLLKYEIRKDSTSGDLLRTVSYTYYKTGHASNITVKDWYVDSSTTPGSAADYDWYHDLALYYFTNGSLRLAMSDKWKLDGQGAPTNYTSLTAREFRYDGIGIARYLAVDYDANNEPTDPAEWTLVGSPMLTDYAGSAPLTDSSITYSSSYSATAETRYFAGDGRQSLGSGGSVEDLRYFHGDLIDSRVLATDDSAAAVATTAYTAFGEAVPQIGSPARPAHPTTLDSRYQYAGSFGYEADMLGVGGPNSNLPPIMLSHVGARWYQPDIGRFVQRDPIGLMAGLNVYAYCKSDPIVYVDPSGFQQGPRMPNPFDPGSNPPPGPWPRGTFPAPRTRPWDIQRAGATVFIELTGGEDSWLDNRPLIRRIQITCGKIATTCIVVASGGMLGFPMAPLSIGVGTAVVTF